MESNDGQDGIVNFTPDYSNASQVPVTTGGSAPETNRDSTAGNIDKIRDILFGSNMRDYEQRFSRLEEALRNEAADLRDAMRKRVETLEAYVQKEFAALESRLVAETDQRSEHHSRLAQDLSTTSAAIHKKIADFENQEALAKREIRSDLLQQSKDLNDAIREKANELAGLLDRRFKELHHAKTDRAGLAELFSEVALRLNDQFKVPGQQ